MSAERDEEVFHLISMHLEAKKIPVDLTRELMDIAKKWRSKATMRATRIEDLEQELTAHREQRSHEL